MSDTNDPDIHSSDPNQPADEFERRARAAGDALRRQPPADGLGQLQRSRQRRAVMRGALVGAAVVALVGGVVAVVRRDDGPAKIATVNSTDTTDGAATSTTSTPPTTAGSTTTAPGVGGTVVTTDATVPSSSSAPSGPPPTGGPSTSSMPPNCDTSTWSTAKQTTGDPLTLSGKVGADVRAGRHDCFERVVIELAGTGDVPGWRVEYLPDPQVKDPSEETVEILGDATLVVHLGCWMNPMDGTGYVGPSDIFPTNVDHVLEMRIIENFEGYSAWAIGLDTERPFTVSVLDSPTRIVIDISNAA